jgi:hypothetical protein
MFEDAFTAKELSKILLLVAIVGFIGAWSIANTAMITRDGVYWIECAQRIDIIESISGIFGIRGQKYLCYPKNGGISGNSFMGISVGINGVSVYEHAIDYLPALAVYTGSLGTGWNYIAVTYTNKQPRIYVNGMLVRTGLTSPKTNVYAVTQLGGGGYGYFKGEVSEFRIWNRALSDAEVLTSAKRDPGGVGPVGEWKFDEGSGTMAHDSSGNNGQAVIRGATWKAYGKGHALEFDGVDDTVQLNCKSPQNDFTVSAWVRTADTHEIPSVVTNLSKIQDPGLSFMVFCWHRLLSCFGQGEGNLDWAMAGQTLGLLCRILSLVPLYYLGKLLVGGRHAFWAVLILIFLPWPAEWGHDVLREWPHLLFLSGGLLMVLLAFIYRRIVFFLPAGLLAGVGHTIRPECAQVIIYALFGLLAVLICPYESMPRKKAVWGVLLLVLGFGTIFAPYIQMRGDILPVKLQQLLTTDNVAVAPVEFQQVIGTQLAGILPASMDGGINLIQTLSENLYYYFFPFMLVGLYVFFKGPQKKSFNRWFIVGFIGLNFLMYTALYYHWGYISRRHLLPLTAIVIFFVPLGIEIVAGLLSRQKTNPMSHIDRKKQTVIFLGLIVVGILACLPKLAEPLGKIGIRKTAEYLKQNTPPDAIIAVSDRRIAFYAERNGVFYKTQPVKGEWDYLVIVEKKDKEQVTPLLAKVHTEPLDGSGRCSQEAVVYRRNKGTE